MSKFLQVHTIDVWHHITKYEVSALRSRYRWKKLSKGKYEMTNNVFRGISNIILTENIIPKTGKSIYTISFTINIGSVLGQGGIFMVDIKKANLNSLFDRMNSFLTEKLFLVDPNSNFRTWQTRRTDVGDDFHTGESDAVNAIYMRILNRSLIPDNVCHAVIREWQKDGKRFDDEVVLSESVRIMHKPNDSDTEDGRCFDYNIYRKAKQMANAGIPITGCDMEKIKDVIRIEKQLTTTGLRGLTTSHKTVENILDETVMMKYAEVIVKDMEKMFGTKDHVAFDEGYSIIKNSDLSDGIKDTALKIYALLNWLGYPELIKRIMKANNIDEKQATEVIKKIRLKVEGLGISMIALRDDEVEVLGASRLKSLPSLFREQYEQSNQRMSKNAFGKIEWIDSRHTFRCKFTVHDFYGHGSRRIKEDKNREKLELKVFDELVNNFDSELKRMVASKAYLWLLFFDIGIKELNNFLTVVNSKDLHAKIEYRIRHLNKQRQIFEKYDPYSLVAIGKG